MSRADTQVVSGGEEALVQDILSGSGVAGLTKDSNPDQIAVAIKAAATVAHRLDPVRRLVLRETVVQLLAGIGFRSPAKAIDAALSEHSPGRAKTESDAGLMLLREVAPASDPVFGTELLTKIVSEIKRYVALSEASATACALWVLHSYALEVSTVSPLLTISSPVKRCGKTTLLTLLQHLVNRPLPASNVTAAVVFRTIEAYEPTLLIDEADTFIQNRDELVGVLNSGHTRANAQVLRIVGDQHEPKAFKTWCAKAIALIGKLPPTLEDRSILVQMRRRAPGERTDRLRLDRLDQELEDLRADSARWIGDNLAKLREADPSVPMELNDRARDNWRPLIAIADAIGGEWPDRSRRAAVEISSAFDEGDQAAGLQILQDVRDHLGERHVDRVFSSELVKMLVAMDERPWAEWRHGKPLTARWLARLLNPFEINSKTIRIGKRTAKGYYAADFADAFERYLPSQRNNPSTTAITGFKESSQITACDDAKEGAKRQEIKVVTDVTARRPGDSSADDREVFEL